MHCKSYRNEIISAEVKAQKAVSVTSITSDLRLPDDLVARTSIACSAGRKVSNVTLSPCWRLMFILFTVVILQQPCECRYLPTRSREDDLDKLRELMLQILEASNEMSATPQQQQRQESELYGGNGLGRRANWLNIIGDINAVGAPRKYNGPHSLYDNHRYY